MSNEYLNNKVFEKIIHSFQKFKKQKVKFNILLEEAKETLIRKKERKISDSSDLKKIKDRKQSCLNACEEFENSKQNLAIVFYTLSENIVRYAKFQLIDIDDAVQEGVMICFEKIDRFNPKKGKAFNYMTTCILNHFRQLYRTARNYNELKKKYLNHMQLTCGTTIIKNKKEISFFEEN
jgi:hypothetical protein